MKKFLKYFLWFLILLIAVIAIVFAARSCSASKRAEKYTGTPEQDRAISEELIAVYSPQHGMADRVLVMQSLHPTLSKMPTEKRHAMLVNAVLTSVDRSLNGLASLPPEKKKEQIRLIQKDAQTSYDFYKKLSEPKKREVRKIIATSGQEMFQKVNLTIASGLSPEDREALGPAIKTWHEILKGQ